MTHNPIPARRLRAAHVRAEKRVIESSLSLRHQLRMNPREPYMKNAGMIEEKTKGLPHDGGSPFREWYDYALTICGINVP